MSALVTSATSELSTEYAILTAAQDGEHAFAAGGGYAVSLPGAVHMTCGNRNAELDVRLEYWDGAPPPAGPEWEDADVLPWLSRPGGGAVEISGFEYEDGDALDLDGPGPALDRGRVQVLAHGRHRYHYDDPVDGLPPERWLLRFWPQAGPFDPFGYPPRRLAVPAAGPLRGDVQHLLRWSDGLLTATPRQFAVRLGTRIEPVLATFQELAAGGQVSVTPSGPGPDEVTTLSVVPR